MQLTAINYRLRSIILTRW